MTNQTKGEIPHFSWLLLNLASAQSLLALAPTLLFLAPDLSSTLPLLSVLLDTPERLKDSGIFRKVARGIHFCLRPHMWKHRKNPDWEFRILASGSVATCLVSRKSLNFFGLFFLTYNMKKGLWFRFVSVCF